MPEPTTTVTPVTDEREAFAQQFDQPTSATAPAAVTPAAPATPATADSLTEKRLHPLRTSEVVFGIASILGWLCFFLAGTVVATAPYRAMIADTSAASAAGLFGAWTVVLTCYTVTNIAFLSCFAAVIGKFSRRSLSYETATIHGLTPAPIASFREVLVFYAVAIARGFVIYLMLAAGLIMLTTDAVTNAKQEEYIRLAGTVSVIAFLAGYDAEIFKRALDRIASLSTDGKRKP